MSYDQPLVAPQPAQPPPRGGSHTGAAKSRRVRRLSGSDRIVVVLMVALAGGVLLVFKRIRWI